MPELLTAYADGVPPPGIGHHGAPCCVQAQAWFLAMDGARCVQNPALPTWIRQNREWGPSPSPLHWCEAAQAKRLDGGALAALALAAFAARGRTAFPCQLIRRFDPGTVAQWRRIWQQAGHPCAWAAGEYACQDACAILSGPEVDIWDPAANLMVRPDGPAGHGSPLALRLRGEFASGVFWGDLHLPMNRWARAEVGKDALAWRLADG
jgi:hypothetical protein